MIIQPDACALPRQDHGHHWVQSLGLLDSATKDSDFSPRPRMWALLLALPGCVTLVSTVLL